MPVASNESLGCAQTSLTSSCDIRIVCNCPNWYPTWPATSELMIHFQDLDRSFFSEARTSKRPFDTFVCVILILMLSSKLPPIFVRKVAALACKVPINTTKIDNILFTQISLLVFMKLCKPCHCRESPQLEVLTNRSALSRPNTLRTTAKFGPPKIALCINFRHLDILWANQFKPRATLLWNWFCNRRSGAKTLQPKRFI